MEEGNNCLYMVGDGGRKQLFVLDRRWRKETINNKTIVCSWAAMEEGNNCLYKVGDGGRNNCLYMVGDGGRNNCLYMVGDGGRKQLYVKGKRSIAI
jgi:hypothetical protein